MDKYVMRKKTLMAVFNWLLFAFLFGLCIVYVTPKPPEEICYNIGYQMKCFSNETVFNEINKLPEHPRDILTHSNVITIDWRYGAHKPYFQAAANCRVVGVATAYVMKVLHDTFGTKYNNMYMIGLDIGAHVAGFAGEEIKLSENLLGRITGLVPASLGFTGDGMKRARLDKSDAKFVDVIHTVDYDKNTLDAAGHADFYPNYGAHQPGCKKYACDHIRAAMYFGESIMHSCSFNSNPCSPSNITAKSGCNATCTIGCAEMGFYADSDPALPYGTFYLETNAVAPFCISV